MMSEITFPNVASATVAIVGLNAALAAGVVEWPSKEQAYFVNEAIPTISSFDNTAAEFTDQQFAHEVASLFAVLSQGQEPLDTEFEAVWDSNVDILYES